MGLWINAAIRKCLLHPPQIGGFSPKASQPSGFFLAAVSFLAGSRSFELSLHFDLQAIARIESRAFPRVGKLPDTPLNSENRTT